MNNSLYSINADILALMDAMEQGEIPEEAFSDTLESLNLEFSEKVDNLICYLKELASRSAAIKVEESNLAERRKAIERKYDRVREYITDAMIRAGIGKIESARNRVSLRRSESTKIADDVDFVSWAMVNRDDLLTYPAPKINLAAVKKAIQNGDKIVGAWIEEKQNLQIK